MAKALKVESQFKGFNISSAGVATIKFRANFDQIADYLNLIGLQDQDLILAVKEDYQASYERVGSVRLKQINFKGNEGADFTFKGEALVMPKFDSFLDKVVTFAVRPVKGGE